MAPNLISNHSIIINIPAWATFYNTAIALEVHTYQNRFDILNGRILHNNGILQNQVISMKTFANSLTNNINPDDKYSMSFWDYWAVGSCIFSFLLLVFMLVVCSCNMRREISQNKQRKDNSGESLSTQSVQSDTYCKIEKIEM